MYFLQFILNTRDNHIPQTLPFLKIIKIQGRHGKSDGNHENTISSFSYRCRFI